MSSIRYIEQTLWNTTLTDPIIWVKSPSMLFNCQFQGVQAFSGTVCNCVKITKYGPMPKNGDIAWDERDVFEKAQNPLPPEFFGTTNVMRTVIVPSSKESKKESAGDDDDKRIVVATRSKKEEEEKKEKRPESHTVPETTYVVTDEWGNEIETKTQGGGLTLIEEKKAATTTVINCGGTVAMGVVGLHARSKREEEL